MVNSMLDLHQQFWERLLCNLGSPEPANRNFKQLENFHRETSNPEFHGFNDRIDINQATILEKNIYIKDDVCGENIP